MRYSNNPKDRARAKLKADVDAFLSAGGRIESLHTSQTSDSKIIYLNHSKTGEPIKMMSGDIFRGGRKRGTRLKR